MHYENTVMEAKIGEMLQSALERPDEHERRAELHAMTMRHREALFVHQIDLLKTARNANSLLE